MKFSKQFIEKYQYYLNCPFTFSGKAPKKSDYSEQGADAIEAFYNAENGINIPTKDSNILEKALLGKAALNWQIKFWATEIAAGRLIPQELAEFHLPKFVKDAIISQVLKHFR